MICLKTNQCIIFEGVFYIFKNKKYLLILITAIIFFAVGSYQLYTASSKEKEIKEDAEKTEESLKLTTEENYIHTLNDFVITASEGDFIIKMTATLHFDNKETFLMFNGVPEGKDNLTDTLLEQDELSVMEVAVNDEIGTLMFDISPDLLFDKKAIKKYLQNGLNDKFGDESKFIKNLYIENLIIQ